MSAKNTPAPWARDWIYGGIRHLNKNVDYEAFCDVETLEKIEAGALNVPNVRVNTADADLITAAPLMADRLEFDNALLKRIASFLETSTDNDELLDDVNSAIGHNTVALRAAGRLP